MQPESLVKLVGSGNTATVEEEWLRLLESSQVGAAVMQAYHPVLSEMSRVGKSAQAETLASTAIEILSEREEPVETLRMASAFLLAIGDSAELRKRVADLHRSLYSDRPHLDALLQEAGLEGGRPVRRALRTLEVCLAIREGDFLAARDEDAAAKVEAIEAASWTITVSLPEGAEQFDPVSLADRFRPAAPTEFAVLRHFAPRDLVDQLNRDPAGFIRLFCLQQGGRTDSDQLRAKFVPAVFSESEFEKWWSRARTAIRKDRHLKLEGRSPYYITYVEAPAGGEDELPAAFKRSRDAAAKLACVERYLRECKNRGGQPSQELLRRCYEQFCTEAQPGRAPASSIAHWTTAWKLGRYAGVEEPPRPLLDVLAQVGDLPGIIQKLEDDSQAEIVCDACVLARADWPGQLLAALPYLPSSVCDTAAERLAKAGTSMSDLRAAVGRILASPIECFDALLWLWDGPRNEEIIADVSPVTVLTRILRALDDCRRDDRVPRPLAKKLANRARSVLSARRYERFLNCISGIDRGMGLALRTQINQLDNLGRSVPEDMLTHLSRAFPIREQQPAVLPWERQDVLYVTHAGLIRKRAEIDHHVNVKMRDNARAIGAAAEHGDLSENSEYKFALEERDLLRARLAQMNAELAKARVLTSADVSTDRVNIGTRVQFRKVDSGELYEMTFVGPWEADHAKGWFNYRAPMALAILGKQVGDEVDFEHGEIAGRYRIDRILNALAETAEEHPAGAMEESRKQDPAPA